MIEEVATVIAIEPGGVWVKTQLKSTCGACQQQDSCTSGLVAKAFTPKEPRLFVNTDLEVLIGQQIRIGLHEDALTQSALRVYLLPLLVFMLTLMAMTRLTDHEGLQLLFAMLMTAASLWWVQRIEKRREKSLQVEILAILPTFHVAVQPSNH